MNEKLDLKTLRLFPYVIFLMIVAIMIGMLSPLIKMLTVGSLADTSMYRMNNTIYMMCFFFLYLATIGILSCLYHMSMISKWFGIACNLSGAFIISEAAYFVAKWMASLYPESNFVEVLLFLVSMIPSISYMLIIVFVLVGAAYKYKELGKKNKKVACKKMVVYWISSFVIQILVNIIIQLEPDDTKVPLGFAIFIGLVFLYSIIVMISSYIRIKQFCYDLYLYTYNGRI